MGAFTGAIVLWPLDWAPYGWALCHGQELKVMEYQALYSLLGNKYGGTVNQTFCLPDLRGRVPVGMGEGPGLQNHSLAAHGGSETVSLSTAHLPYHTHAASLEQVNFNGTISGGSISDGECEVSVPLPKNAANAPAETNIPSTDTSLGIVKVGSSNVNIYTKSAPTLALNHEAVSAKGTVTGKVTGGVTGNLTGYVNVEPTGSSAPVKNMQPYLVLNYIICLQGNYPTRD
ncbi:phage tail protein [Brevibacillus sp. SIMBA_040]|uniref:phage tail protein n=1 Tax=unclassified Brevibacillus TaxID=2684853 RepID=UPI00397BD3BF